MTITVYLIALAHAIREQIADAQLYPFGAVLNLASFP